MSTSQLREQPAGDGGPAVVEPSSRPLPVGVVLLPLRAFLGFTFCFAGLQKLANPGFFRASDPASIQAQLQAYARISPVGGLLRHLTGVAGPIGLAIAIGELAVGLGTLLGLWSRIAAAGGALLSLSLFLTVSFRSEPYYTGSDVVFLFAWTPLLLAGSGGVLAMDRWLERKASAYVAAERSAAAVPMGRLGGQGGQPTGVLTAAPDDRPDGIAEVHRRSVLLRIYGAFGVALVATVGGVLDVVIGRAAGRAQPGSTTPKLQASTARPSSTTVPSTSSRGPSGSGRAAESSRPAVGLPGREIGQAARVTVGGAATFVDPYTGDPGIVVRPARDAYLAFDALCPHAGCTVQYRPDLAEFVCPCHGSTFNGTTGAVQIGPATRGLTPIAVLVGSDGEIYAQD